MGEAEWPGHACIDCGLGPPRDRVRVGEGLWGIRFGLKTFWFPVSSGNIGTASPFTGVPINPRQEAGGPAPPHPCQPLPAAVLSFSNGSSDPYCLVKVDHEPIIR